MRTIAEVLPGIIGFRHELHRIPEIAGEEFETMRRIRERLAALDVEVLPPFLGTDTVAILRGAKPGKNLTLRADIDALQIDEKTGLPYASTRPGMMHACGHDAHAAMLLGAAEVLASVRDELRGTIRFVWQPGEENRAMARQLIEAGALDDPPPAMVAAIHMHPGAPVGSIRIREGAMYAATAHFEVTFRGKSGHGSRPDRSRNPLTAAAFAVAEAQSIVPNRLSPFHSGVISICYLNSGMFDNVIPDEAVLGGTIRSFDPADAEMLASALREVCEGAAKMHRVDCEVGIDQSYLPVVNTPEETRMAIRAAVRAGLKAEIMPEPLMEGEDFSYFLSRAPGAMIRLGNGEDSPVLHNSKFDANDGALRYGIGCFVELARDFSVSRA